MPLTSRTRRTMPRRRAARPRVESLEGRLLLNAGDLDTTFGGTGFVVTNLGQPDERATSVVVQPWDNKIVVASRDGYGGQPYEFALARYNSLDGTLDTSFGSGGIVAIHVSSGDDMISQIILTPDEKILAVGSGYTNGGSQDVALARFNSNGTLDNTFGSGGVVLTPVSGKANGSGTSLILDSSGRIIVGGSSYEGKSGSYTYANVLLRYNANGSLDTTFGNRGKVVGNYGSYTYDGWGTLEILGSGSSYKIGVLGKDNGNNVIAHFNTNGSRDTTFGSNGEVVLANGGGNTFQSDGKIVGAYETGVNGNSATEVVRYNADGTADTTFGTGGAVITLASTFGGSIARPDAVAIDASGRIVVAGGGGSANRSLGSLLVRYTAAGSLDTSFGGTGWVVTDISQDTDNEEFTTLVFQPEDGKIVAAGYVPISSDPISGSETLRLSVARFFSDASAPASAATLSPLTPTPAAPMPDPTLVSLAIESLSFVESLLPGRVRHSPRWALAQA